MRKAVEGRRKRRHGAAFLIAFLFEQMLIQTADTAVTEESYISLGIPSFAPFGIPQGLKEPGRISTQYLLDQSVGRLDKHRKSYEREDSSDAPIRIEDEGNVLHLAVRELLLELDAVALKVCACGLDVVDGDGDVAKAATGVLVSAGVALEGGVGLGAVVVGELEDALAVEAVLGGGALAVVVGEEVEGERLERVFC